MVKLIESALLILNVNNKKNSVSREWKYFTHSMSYL